MGTGGSARAGRPGYSWTDWYHYSWDTFSIDELDYLVVNLDNEENGAMIKDLWVSFTFTGALPANQHLVYITSYYENLGLPNDTESYGIGNGLEVFENCVWLETSIFPQPDRESFVIALGDADDFYVDCVQLATKCVPIPSTLLLLGGGLAGLIGFRRRRTKRS
jgi:hypothetical protein